MKTCTKCKIEKPRNDFGLRLSSKDGLQPYCRLCAASYAKAYAAINRETESARCKRYKELNANQVMERNKAYRERNRIRAIEYQRKYKKENPDKISAKKRNERARYIKAGGIHTYKDVRKIFEAQRGMCANCHAKLFKSGKHKYHVDHIMPLARGGTNWPINLQCLCPDCNLRKSAKDPFDWALENGRLL